MEKYIIDSFINKHGKNIFNEIRKMIYEEMTENKSDFNDEYLSYIFEIATYEYCGIEKEKIPVFISKMGNNFIPKIPYNELRKTHQNSINEIIKHLEQAVGEIE